MLIIKNIAEIRNELSTLKANQQSIALVPTMGCLHEGHLSLVKKAREVADKVVVSIFVNRQQFNDSNDFQKYPRQVDLDCRKLEEQGVNIVFVPDDKEIYKNKPLINIDIPNLTNCLCGVTRKGHFNGVCLIIAKLFNIIQPNFAIFGEKDFQQLQIIKRLTSDLNYPIKIIGFPTQRQEDGLALSSRNILLSDEDKKIAIKIQQILREIRSKLVNNFNLELAEVLSDAKNHFLKNGFRKIDYLEIRQEEDLQLVVKINQSTKSRIFFAGFVGDVRLIDNLLI